MRTARFFLKFWKYKLINNNCQIEPIIMLYFVIVLCPIVAVEAIMTT